MADKKAAREEKQYDDKAVAFYEAALEAWYTTRFELDKALLALSSGAIGLFVTLLATDTSPRTLVTMLFFVFATICFTATIISVLKIFRLNGEYLEKVIHDPQTGSNPQLRTLDRAASISFAFGVLFSAAIVASVLVPNICSEEKQMVQKENTSTDGREIVKKSVDGASKLQPAQQPKQDQQTNKPTPDSNKK